MSFDFSASSALSKCPISAALPVMRIIRHAENVDYLFANPFVLSNGVSASGNKKPLQEPFQGVVQALESLEVQPALYKGFRTVFEKVDDRLGRPLVLEGWVSWIEMVCQRSPLIIEHDDR
jgi:hypothetical protein